jgi:hypothetical protein
METSREVSEVSEKIEQFYSDATAEDVSKVIKGETVEVRVRDDDDDDWRYGEYLGGVHRGNCDEFKWKDRDGVPWIQCQVYDPPEWYVNKPEPGEGYRLLEKFPPEDLQKGDEAFGNNRDGEWGKSDYAERGLRNQCKTLWYRRRIANNPASSDSSDYPAVSDSSRPLGWRALLLDEPRLASDAYWSQGCKEWVLIGNDRGEYANRDRWPAIRQVVYYDHQELRLNGVYSMPGGQTIRITAKGFEVL